MTAARELTAVAGQQGNTSSAHRLCKLGWFLWRHGQKHDPNESGARRRGPPRTTSRRVPRRGRLEGGHRSDQRRNPEQIARVVAAFRPEACSSGSAWRIRRGSRAPPGRLARRGIAGLCHGESRGHRDRRRAPVRPVPAPTRHVRRRRRTPSRCQGAVGTKPPSAWNVSDGLILCSSRRSPPRGMMPRRSGGGGGQGPTCEEHRCHFLKASRFVDAIFLRRPLQPGAGLRHAARAPAVQWGRAAGTGPSAPLSVEIPRACLLDVRKT